MASGKVVFDYHSLTHTHMLFLSLPHTHTLMLITLHIFVAGTLAGGHGVPRDAAAQALQQHGAALWWREDGRRPCSALCHSQVG